MCGSTFNGSDSEFMASMQMSLSSSPSIGTFLIKGWKGKEPHEYMEIILFVILWCFTQEALINLYCKLKKTIKMQEKIFSSKGSLNPLLFVNSLLYMVIKLMNYINMLISMTYNIPLIIILCLALATGESIRYHFQDRQYIERYQ